MYPSKKVKTDKQEMCTEKVTWVSEKAQIKRIWTFPTAANLFLNCEGGILLKEQIIKSKLLRVMYE